MRGLDSFFASLSLLSFVLAVLGLFMDQYTANFLKGLFNGLTDKTAYRFGLWVNGLLAAVGGGLLGGVTNVGMQAMASPGPLRWAAAVEWAKGAAIGGLSLYFVKSPLQNVFAPDSVTVQQTSVTTPTTQTESTVVIAQTNEQQ